MIFWPLTITIMSASAGIPLTYTNTVTNVNRKFINMLLKMNELERRPSQILGTKPNRLIKRTNMARESSFIYEKTNTEIQITITNIPVATGLPIVETKICMPKIMDDNEYAPYYCATIMDIYCWLLNNS